ncbi:hypothetical protein G436_1344 [Leptospira interrogans serovar Hardjo str. Norma]|uniref:Uncharacterized protein n=1 Tax=Leptospira interrogans serovar Hardjo str. Norma TaxID=1279460 RepID=A0A0M4NIB2_LEPIR|nr:hypothetical protein G436_1344 [Leptospira interrogans serovar Hardjo str. Norma]
MVFFSKIELLKNSIIDISKTVSMIHFNATDTNGELIFQQLYL